MGSVCPLKSKECRRNKCIVMNKGLFNYVFHILKCPPILRILLYFSIPPPPPKTQTKKQSTRIIGLYITFILLIGRFLRGAVTGQRLTIMFRELPDADKVIRLCLDLYLMREMKEYHLEEDLYASLIFLYRSPETMIKYTRQTVRIGNIKQKSD